MLCTSIHLLLILRRRSFMSCIILSPLHLHPTFLQIPLLKLLNVSFELDFNTKVSSLGDALELRSYSMETSSPRLVRGSRLKLSHLLERTLSVPNLVKY